MKPFQFDNDFFLSIHCPPIPFDKTQNPERTLNRLREAVNWQIQKWIDEAPVVLDAVEDDVEASICDMSFIKELKEMGNQDNRKYGRLIMVTTVGATKLQHEPSQS